MILSKNLTPLIPKTGGGLSMETYLFRNGKRKYVLKRCNSKTRSKNYISISRKLSRYKILPSFLFKNGNDLIYEYLSGRDLRKKESLKNFEEVGKICAIINNLSRSKKLDNSSFNKKLSQLESGNYPIYSVEQMTEKKRRRPNERHDRRRIKSLITKEEKRTIKILNESLIKKTKAREGLDACDVSPANFRLYNGKVYFVDIGGIQSNLVGIGLAKGLWDWAETDSQRNALLKGYESISKLKLTEDYLVLMKLHYLVQALHDRAKLGRSYKTRLGMLRELIKEVVSEMKRE